MGMGDKREKALFTATDCIIAMSRMMKEYIVSTPVSEDKVHIVSNGVDTERVTPGDGRVTRRKYGLPTPADPGREGDSSVNGDEHGVVIGFLGTFGPDHGVTSMVEALGRMRNRDSAWLFLVGDGPQRSDVMGRIRELGLESRVKLTPSRVPNELVPEYLGAFDIACAPYRSFQGFYFSPLKLFEYMAAGLPVVAPPLGQIEEIIADGRTGLFYRSDDALSMAEVLDRLVADGDLRRRIGRAARKTAVEKHSWDAAVSQLERAILDHL
jgi:glycosyltransferase involved in cell wall biosynthesis